MQVYLLLDFKKFLECKIVLTTALVAFKCADYVVL